MSHPLKLSYLIITNSFSSNHSILFLSLVIVSLNLQVISTVILHFNLIIVYSIYQIHSLSSSKPLVPSEYHLDCWIMLQDHRIIVLFFLIFLVLSPNPLHLDLLIVSSNHPINQPSFSYFLTPSINHLHFFHQLYAIDHQII